MSALLSGKSTVPRAYSLARFFASSSGPYDVVVIGGGPGGYVCAIKAAQLNLKTACIESRGALGGTCLNVGCIPSKALLYASHHYHDAKHNFAKYGINVSGVSIDIPKMMQAKQKAVSGLTTGVEGLFKKNKVDYVKGFGKLAGPNKISVKLLDGSEQVIEAKNIVIATGSEPATLPNVEVDEKRIVTSTGALSFSEVPKKLIVIGAGVIGLEMGSVWNRLGSEVLVVEYLDRIIPGTDAQIASEFQKILMRQKFKFMMSTKVEKATQTGSGVKLTVSGAKDNNKQELEADAILVATGRRPFTKNLGLEAVGIEMEGRGIIKTDKHFRTNVPSIYAIGDVIKGPMLAHKAEEEGIAVAEILAGQAGHVNYDAIPGVIYTHPEVAVVGATEEQLNEAKIPFKKGVFPFKANSRARTYDDADGMVKVLGHAKTDRLLGMHIVGPNAGELIAEGVLGIEYQASTEDVARTCHAHPTLGEAVKEACLAVTAKPIHF
jgi:dihydrolipoamide dehydrogenase